MTRVRPRESHHSVPDPGGQQGINLLAAPVFPAISTASQPMRYSPAMPDATGRPTTLDSLRAELDAIGPLIDEAVPLPRSGHPLTITRPTDMDGLLDRIAGDPEQNLPYWAELWPSGIALADAILREPDLVHGKAVLELGCGAGTTAAAAILAGAHLTVTDYAPEALTLCRYNTLVNAAAEPAAAVQLNWRAPDAGFLRLAGAGFPVVLVADGLYETRDIEPLLALAGRIVAPGSLLWLAEPGREVAARFLERARAEGWDGPSDQHAGPWPDAADDGVRVGLHRLRRG